jgi:hypothetical protein
MRWEGLVACMGKMRNVNKIYSRKTEGKTPLARPGVDGGIVLKRVS